MDLSRSTHNNIFRKLYYMHNAQNSFIYSVDFAIQFHSANYTDHY